MIFRIVPAIFALLVSVCDGWAQLRNFKDTSGRAVKASVESVSAAGDSINLLSAKGKRYTVPVDRFSEADREYIRKWAAENPGSAAISSLRIELNSKRRKIPNPRGRLDPKYSKISDSETFFEIMIENPTREPVPGMKFEYVIYKREYVRTDGKRTKFEISETKKVHSLGTVAAGEKRLEKTVTVGAKTRVQRADRKKDIPEVNTSETVLGIIVDFYINDRKIETVPYPPNMLIKVQEEAEREKRRAVEEQGRRGDRIASPNEQEDEAGEKEIVSESDRAIQD